MWKLVNLISTFFYKAVVKGLFNLLTAAFLFVKTNLRPMCKSYIRSGLGVSI